MAKYKRVPVHDIADAIDVHVGKLKRWVWYTRGYIVNGKVDWATTEKAIRGSGLFAWTWKATALRNARTVFETASD